MSKVTKKITYDAGQLGWTVWAAFRAVQHDQNHTMNYDQALKSLLPGCSDYDLTLLTAAVLPDMEGFLKRKDLKFENQQVMLHARERLLEEMRRREIPITTTVDEVSHG